jgi:hypothetical protein
LARFVSFLRRDPLFLFFHLFQSTSNARSRSQLRRNGGIWSSRIYENKRMETSTQIRSRNSTSSRIDRANAPGKRGPTPTSCAGCRRVRSKCFRKNGGKVGEETCVGCLRRGKLICYVSKNITESRADRVPRSLTGIECKLPHEISHYRKVGSITNCAERSLVAFEVSAELVTGLFDVRLKPGRGGYAVCHMTRFALDLETMEDKFHSV